MLRDLAPRLYQQTILGTAALKNTLVVLPTGLGKTAIAVMLASQRLTQYPDSKVLFLTPTKPLAEQHLATLERHLGLPQEAYALFTGAVSPAERAALWQKTRIVVGTPQGVENDVLGNKIDLTHVSLLVLDEAHHATGNYSYCFLAKQYAARARFPRILGLTASPGSDLEKIREICRNLFVEAVEVRTLQDADVAPYVQDITTDWVEVDLPEPLVEVQKLLADCLRVKLAAVQHLGYVHRLQMSRKELLQLQAQLHGEIAQGSYDGALLHAVSLVAEALKVYHALELLETQGIAALSKYLQKLEAEARQGKSKAARNLAADALFKSACVRTARLVEANVEHPKLAKTAAIVQEELARDPQAKTIVFTQYRDSGVEVVKALRQLPGMRAALFVGQAKRGETGLSQKEQKAMLDEFRAGKVNALVCTSVGEEGLDIPAVDLVLFYEPIPSAIRHIQRRGRTGRQRAGRVLVLVTKGTRDATYRWAAYHREKRMHHVLRQLKRGLAVTPVEMPVRQAAGQQVQVVADYREKGSEVMKQLVELGLVLQLEKLQAADYLCSAQCAVEFKTVEDFVSSLIDGRLLEQLKELKRNFAKPLVIVQGTQDIYAVRKVHPNAIRGMLATIAVSFGIPILQTKNALESAGLIAVIARREQDTSRDVSLHAKKPLTLSEQQEYLVSALPGVGLKMAQALLKHFGTVERLATATAEELKNVEGVGEVIAARIREVLEKEYRKG